MTNPVSSVAKAIESLATAVAAWLNGSTNRYNRKQVERMRKAIEIAERYIRIAPDDNIDAQRKHHQLKKLEDEFFKYNN